MNARRGALAVTLLILTLGGTLGLAAGPADAAEHHHVVIRQYAYSPPALTVDAGDTVTWTNEDTAAHDVTVTRGPQSFRSPLLAKGQSWSHTFGTPGSYSYICSVHPDMKASVTVRPVAQTPQVAPAPPQATPQQIQKQTQKQTQAPRKAVTPKPAVTPTTAAPAAGSAEAPVAAAPAVQQAVVTDAGATVDPLLLVAGLSAAVTIFCLLLIVGRP